LLRLLIFVEATLLVHFPRISTHYIARDLPVVENSACFYCQWKLSDVISCSMGIFSESNFLYSGKM